MPEKSDSGMEGGLCGLVERRSPLTSCVWCQDSGGTVTVTETIHSIDQECQSVTTLPGSLERRYCGPSTSAFSFLANGVGVLERRMTWTKGTQEEQNEAEHTVRIEEVLRHRQCGWTKDACA